MEVRLSELIAPQFYDIHWDIIEGRHTHYKLYGGRGSTKSSFVSIEIIMGMMEDPDANAACFRRVGNTLAESVFEQLLWAIDALGVAHLWKPSISPLRLTYKPTGQRIVFRGCDDPNKSKSIKLRHGYFKYIWYEERAEFEGDEDERKINQSLMRGGDKYVVFYTWNPPKSLNSWVNQDVLQEREDTLCSHSTYLTVPREWLGEQFFIEAEELKKRKRLAYRHALHQMNQKVKVNIAVEQAYMELAEQMDLEEACAFGEILLFAKRLGGNYGKNIQRTATKLGEKMSLQEEITTMMAQKKLEMKVMLVIPLAIIAYVRLTSADLLAVLYGNLAGGLIMSACLVVYVLMALWSRRIMDIVI